MNHVWLAQQMSIHGTAANVARTHGLNERAVQRQVQRIVNKDAWATGQRSELARMVRDMERTCPINFIMDEITVSGRGVVSSDWHLPLTDYERAARLIESADKTGCTDYLLIVGDYFNLDALSVYAPKQDDAGLVVEIERGGMLMDMLLDVFDRVVVSRGNHDERLVNTLGWKIRFEQSIKMLLPNLSDERASRMEVTALDYVFADTEHGMWMNAHTNQYSKIPLAVPRELCDIHQMHVAAGHRHHHAIGRSKAGYYAVETGGLFDGSKTAYLKKWTSTFPKWCPGWMVLHEAGPYLPELAPAPIA